MFGRQPNSEISSNKFSPLSATPSLLFVEISLLMLFLANIQGIFFGSLFKAVGILSEYFQKEHPLHHTGTHQYAKVLKQHWMNGFSLSPNWGLCYSVHCVGVGSPSWAGLCTFSYKDAETGGFWV